MFNIRQRYLLALALILCLHATAVCDESVFEPPPGYTPQEGDAEVITQEAGITVGMLRKALIWYDIAQIKTQEAIDLREACAERDDIIAERSDTIAHLQSRLDKITTRLRRFGIVSGIEGGVIVTSIAVNVIQAFMWRYK